MAREPIVFQIPGNIESWEANNWRKVANALNTSTDITTSDGTIKISDTDKVSDNLDGKLIAGTGITITKSNTGSLGKEILTVAVTSGSEPALGNPGVDDYVLSSKIDGTRSWVEMTGGTGGGMSLLEIEFYE